MAGFTPVNADQPRSPEKHSVSKTDTASDPSNTAGEATAGCPSAGEEAQGPVLSSRAEKISEAQEDGSAVTVEDLVNPLALPNVTLMSEVAPTNDVEELDEAIGDDDIDNEQLNKPGYRGLNRHIYAICGSGASAGEKITTRKLVESANCPYWAWPIYNDFKQIIKADKSSWPPSFVNLQDWHVKAILSADLPIHQCHARWPADFSGAGNVHLKRKPKGRAGKVRYGNKLHYAVVCDVYQLSGDEAAQEVITLPYNEDAPISPRNHVGIGQLCEVQREFNSSLEELVHGILLERIDDSIRAARPLSNRGDWGPERRVGQPKASNKKTGKPKTKTKANPSATAKEEKEDNESGESDQEAKSAAKPAPTRKRASPPTPPSSNSKPVKKVKAALATLSSKTSIPKPQSNAPVQSKKQKVSVSEGGSVVGSKDVPHDTAKTVKPAEVRKPGGLQRLTRSPTVIQERAAVRGDLQKHFERIKGCAQELVSMDYGWAKQKMYESIIEACDEVDAFINSTAGTDQNAMKE